MWFPIKICFVCDLEDIWMNRRVAKYLFQAFTEVWNFIDGVYIFALNLNK